MGSGLLLTLIKSKIFTYCLNPYTGCQINCRYCYAQLFIRRYSNHSEAWEECVDAKINAPEVEKNIKGLYRQVGIRKETAARFFREYKERLIFELERIKI